MAKKQQLAVVVHMPGFHGHFLISGSCSRSGAMSGPNWRSPGGDILNGGVGWLGVALQIKKYANM
jgi:hypothetical protein